MSGASLNGCVSVDASIVHGAKVRAFPLGQANSGINPERPMEPKHPIDDTLAPKRLVNVR